MARLNLTEAGERFLREWENDSEYISAHTSGSTGTPKEIHLLKEDMRQSARATNSFFKIARDSIIVSPLSAGYIAGKMMIVRALEAGCRLFSEEPSNHPLRKNYGSVDLLPIVPSQIDGLLESQYLPTIRNIIVGGAPMSSEQERKLTVISSLNIYSTYGMTETCSHVALRAIGQPLYEAMPGITFDVDSRSCLIVKAPGFSFGELTTNDIVALTDSTHFCWKGRADNVVISGGIKIFPEEIEQKVSEHIPWNFYFIGEPDSKWGERLIMKVEYAGIETEHIERRLRDILSANLPKFHFPKEIIFLPEFSRTSNGKIRRV